MRHPYAHHGVRTRFPNAAEKVSHLHAGIDYDRYGPELEEGETDQEEVEPGTRHDQNSGGARHPGFLKDAGAGVGVSVQLGEGQAMVQNGTVEPSSSGNAGGNAVGVALRNPR